MALVTTRLNNNGLTTHFQFQYDSSLQLKPLNPNGREPARTNQIIAACEADFTLMSDWFGNIDLGMDFPINVNLIPQNVAGACSAPGACWGSSRRILTVTVSDVSMATISATMVRYLMISEIVEVFMMAQPGQHWFGSGTEGSKGEGLSRFLAAQFLLVNGFGNPPSGYLDSNLWLNSPRYDYVNYFDYKASKDIKPDAVTGCSLLFIWYLFSQLGFSVKDIVRSGADTLAGVYRNLTRDAGEPFTVFKQLVDAAFPGVATINTGNFDNPFPLGTLVWHHGATNETQLWYLDRQALTSRATVVADAPIFVGLPFTIVGAGVVSSDGKHGLIWYNNSTFETQIWAMDGFKIAYRQTVVDESGKPIFVGPPFTIVAAGDMNGDGYVDLVWHNSSTLETQIWFLDTGKLVRRATVVAEDGKPIFVGPPFSIVAAGDMNGNGVCDLIWHNSSTNETQIWFMSGEKIVRRGTVVDDQTGKPVFVGAPWSIVASGRLGGILNDDLVWHNSSTNETQIWSMNEERITFRATVIREDGKPIFVGLPWRIAAASDLNGNGRADLIWHDGSTNETQVWFMSGHQLVSRATVEAEAPAFVGGPWRIVASQDVDGDGKFDLIWHNGSTGEVQVWFMNFKKLAGRATVVDETGKPAFVGPPWTLVTAADMGGDGRPDLIWRHSSTHETQIWFMNGTRITGRATVVDETGKPIFVDLPFSLAAAGDMNGNGTADLIWHNSTTKETQIWFMNGHTIIRRATVLDETGKPIFVALPWSIVGSYDVDGDGKSDLIWHEGSTGETQIWFMDGEKLKGRATVLDEVSNPIFVVPPWNVVGAARAVVRKKV